MGKQFAVIQGIDTGSGFAWVNSDEYVFVSCYYYGNEESALESCARDFERRDDQYSLLKSVFSSEELRIFLLKRAKADSTSEAPTQ